MKLFTFIKNRRICPALALLLLFATTVWSADNTDDRRMALLKRSERNTQEAQEALARNDDLYSIINLRFFGSFAAMDQYIELLHKKLCLGDPRQIIAIYDERRPFSYRQQAFGIITETKKRINKLTDAEKGKLKKSWSYRQFLTYYDNLNCVLEKADQLLASGDPIDRIEARYIYDSITGFRHASDKQAQLLLEDASLQSERLLSTPLIPNDLDTYDIFQIQLGATLPEAQLTLPDLKISEDNRHNQSVFGVKATFQKFDLRDNEINLEILFSGDMYGSGSYDLYYTLNTAGLKERETKKIILKLFQKYGPPTFDLTEQTDLFTENHLEFRLSSAQEKPATFCWGACNKVARNKAFEPGKRMIFTFSPAKSLLSLRLFDNALEPVHNDLEQEWLDLSKEFENDKDELIF